MAPLALLQPTSRRTAFGRKADNVSAPWCPLASYRGRSGAGAQMAPQAEDRSHLSIPELRILAFGLRCSTDKRSSRGLGYSIGARRDGADLFAQPVVSPNRTHRSVPPRYTRRHASCSLIPRPVPRFAVDRWFSVDQPISPLRSGFRSEIRGSLAAPPDWMPTSGGGAGGREVRDSSIPRLRPRHPLLSLSSSSQAAIHAACSARAVGCQKRAEGWALSTRAQCRPTLGSIRECPSPGISQDDVAHLLGDSRDQTEDIVVIELFDPRGIEQ